MKREHPDTLIVDVQGFLHPQTRNALLAHGFEYVRDIEEATDEELLSLSGFGFCSLMSARRLSIPTWNAQTYKANKYEARRRCCNGTS